MQNNGRGDMANPFSKFTDTEKLAAVVKEKSRAASPTTVTNIITLPGSPNKKALKNYLREKLFLANHDIRSVLYKSLIKRIECNESMFSEQLYEDYVTENFTDDVQIKLSNLPTFVKTDTLPFYCLNEIGKQTLFRILACIGFHFPQVTFSPLLPAAASLLLHYDDDPNQVFSHLCRLIFSNSKSIHYLDINKTEADASSLVLKDLSQRFAPSSHKSLLSLTTDTLTVYNEWITCLFMGLPFTFVVVLFDMYLLEGYKALYRVSLAILKYYRKIGISNASDIVSAVFQFVQHLEMTISVSLLFRKAFGFKLPPSKEIKKLQKRIKSSLGYEDQSIADKKPCRNPWDYLPIVRDVKSDIVNETLLSTLYCSIPENAALYKPVLLFSTSAHGYRMQTLFSRVEHHDKTLLLIKTTADEVLGAYLGSPWSKRRPRHFFGSGDTLIFSLLPEAKIYKWVVLQEKTTMVEKYDSLNKKQLLPPVKPPGGTNKGKGVTLPPIHHDVHTATPVTPVSRSSHEPIVLPPLVGSSCSSPVPQLDHPGSSAKTIGNDMFMLADDTGLIVGGGKGFGLFLDADLCKGHTQHCATFNNLPLVPSEAFTCSVVEVFGCN